MNKKILIVDDEKDIVDIMSMFLNAEGYYTSCAYDGLDALEKVKCNKPDLIVLDVMMPRMDGFTVNQKLKENPETKDIPVIVVTGKNDLRKIEEAVKKDSIKSYIKKPFSMTELLEKTRSIFF
ncbi:MAG: hypothetical protein A2474_05845 [Elusimicrobia bacterium RIFOXYC2_FULL_34_12]|nr:MAG: hypothetical protein A2474_05845 [Elusimicrobia bacterium RIFOXYC2_FULL_34_12]OGS39000.1 MAG: hypothetical protein A2551_04665 [Elusimicrobia bacterium RIFOXYD2_FULL_34_30]